MTLHAMGGHKDMARTIIQPDADDVVALQETQATLYEAVTLVLPDARAPKTGQGA